MTTLHFIVTNQPVASSSVTFIFSVLICAGHFWWLFSVLVAHCWRSLSLPWFSLKIVKRTSILGLIQTTSFRTGGTLCTAVSRCLTSIASCTWKVWPAAVLVPGSGGEAMGNWGWWKGDRENLPTPPFPGVRPCRVDGGVPWWCGMPPIRLCVRMKGLQPLSPFSSHLSLLPPCFVCVCVCVCVCVWISQSRPTLYDPVDCSPPGSSVHGILQARILEWVAISLLQGILPTQRLNPGLLHCRQIPYHLSHQGSPSHLISVLSSSLPFSVPTSFPLSLSYTWTDTLVCCRCGWCNPLQ